MKTVVLDVKTVGGDIDFSEFNKFGDVTIYQTTPQEEAAERINGADIVIVNKVRLNESNLKNSGVRLICETATGYDNIDTDYCRKNGIAVCNVSGYSTDSVAQVTAAMALSLFSKLSAYNRFVCDGSFEKHDLPMCTEPVFYEVSGKTWGIIGMGTIGKKVAAVAKALGMNVIAYSRTEKEGFENVGLDELCQRSDIISLHCPLNDGTYHIINENNLSLMKNTAVLINAARGAVVDEKAVTDAIKSGKIGAFAADVYSKEPISPDNPYNEIAGRDNVILTPHMAWGAKEARQRCVDETVKNVQAFLDGEMRNRIV